ncbi:carotenoid biosynthesis protein [Deinococcus radiopugnans]|uniref:Membrane protein n=1 Tax=Deinococcus radiopugnans ATCC 19172 TaxID=585398 RepID=A0ABR6NY13_9DEIO|nr:carotenoid biosynthesis protein [Deinococcus radiopugnans]MBB6018339.1 putative membrane protein [Deinococcus radiopugnans ATCC 19172]
MIRLPSHLLRFGLAFAALGVAFLGALLVLADQSAGWALIGVGVPLSGVLALAGDALGSEFSSTLQARTRQLISETRPWMWLIALYAVLHVPVPLWPEGFGVLGLASTAALFVGALLYAAERVGWGRSWLMALLACGLGLSAEVIGTRTGFPFGIYSYATAPDPLVLGVPLMVPLGWFALTLAGLLLSGGRAWLAGLLLALWDVGLEPLMTAQRYWLWSDPNPIWAGAPLQNFLGWWAVGGGISWVITRVGPEVLQARKGEAQINFAVAYPIEAFFLPGGLVLVGRYLEAAVTLLAMLLGLALARLVRRRG